MGTDNIIRLVLWAVLGVLANGKKQLYLGGFFSMTGPEWQGGQTTLPGVQYAIDLVNNRSDILPDYELVLLWNDTQGSATISMKHLFDFLYTPPKKIMLIGPVRSKMATPVAEAASGWNLMQMSFGARTPDLSCKTRFPYFFRTIGPDEVFNPVKVELFNHFRWKRVACLYQFHAADVYSAATDDFMELWRAHNNTIVAAESVANPGASLDLLKKLDARIIVANIFFDKAREVFCEAYKRGMYGKKYVWVLLGWISFNWWDNPHHQVNCTTQQLKEAAEGVIMTDFMHSYAGTKEAFGVAPEKFENYIRQKSSRFDHYASYAFDGMMSLALTLHHAAQEGVALETFCYTNASYVETFVRIMSELEFDGLTGTVAFDKKGNRIGVSAITQNQGGVEKYVGKYCPFDLTLNLDSDTPLKWVDDKVPKDGFTRETRKEHLPHVAFIAFMCVGTSGALLCLVFLVFNIKNKELKYIKLSSPKMNNVILLGCMLAYLALILNGLDGRFLSPSNYGIVCNVRAAVLSVSFTVAFGAMFTKTWRVHQIMANKSVVRRVVKDLYLMSSVAGLLGLDAIIFIAWFTHDPLDRSIVKLPERADPIDCDHIVQPLQEICSCRFEGYWVAALLVVKGLVLLFGLFLAWETRKITVEALNDSRYIGMSVYNIAMVCAIAVPVNYLVGVDNYTSLYIISSFSIILCTTVTVCLVFVPKVYGVWKDPTGSVDMKFGTTPSETKVTPFETLTQQISTQRRLEALLTEKENRIKHLEGELSATENSQNP